MKRLLTAAAILMTLTVSGCSKETTALEIEPGHDVTLQKKDGVVVVGRLVEVKPEHVILEERNGTKTSIARKDVASLSYAPLPKTGHTAAAATDGRPAGSAGTPGTPTATIEKPNPLTKVADRGPDYREVTVPSGTLLPVELSTGVASATSRVEDPVRATLRRAITIGGVQALPAGTLMLGNVTAVERAARVKGRARIAFRFTSIDPPGDAERLSIRTQTVSRLAPATKKQDAAKIGGGAVGGAIIGGIIGGGDGAAKGAAVGGAAGTGVVLSTRGKDVRLPPGTNLAVRLSAPLTVRVASR
jgi:outer membrane lipoprotein SlyB